MQRFTKAIAAILLTMAMFVIVGCNKQGDSDVRVTTYTPQDITQTSAVCGGDVIVTQGLSLSELGVCWSTKSKPTAEDSHLSTMNWNEPFVSIITGLEPGTKYHVRAYALRGLEYYYGDEKSFITESNSHAYIDLGLPSGTLWATCNVGADTPEGYGDYFAWGETEPKSVYDWSTYRWCNGDIGQLTKYCFNSDCGYNGFVDSLMVLQPSDDAATVNWGDGWRMPTKEEFEELYQNTTCIWTVQNDVNGHLFIASNGMSLFLPAAGSIWNEELKNSGRFGSYWSTSLYTDNSPYNSPLNARYFGFGSANLSMSGCAREGGLTVRAVWFAGKD